jgi:hypothetical protein
VEAGGECDVAELVDGYLSQEFLGEVQGETRPQRLEHGLELLAAHRGQAGDKFVQFLVRHGVYTQEKPGRLAIARPTEKKPRLASYYVSTGGRGELNAFADSSKCRAVSRNIWGPNWPGRRATARELCLATGVYNRWKTGWLPV